MLRKDKTIKQEGKMIQTELAGLMTRYNLSREDIASRLGVSSMTIYRWETGRVEPKSRALIRAFEQFKKDLKSNKGL